MFSWAGTQDSSALEQKNDVFLAQLRMRFVFYWTQKGLSYWIKKAYQAHFIRLKTDSCSSGSHNWAGCVPPLYSLPWTMLQCTLSYIIMSLHWLRDRLLVSVSLPANSCQECVCVCVCSLLSWSARPLRIRYKKSDYLNVSGANCQKVLSWLLFLEKLAKH